MDKKIILLVEDNLDDVDLTLHAFKINNIKNKVVVVNDGVAALDYLFGTGEYVGRDSSSLPTIILLDIKLPKIDGLEVLRRIKANPLTQFIPVIILTSSKEEQDIISGYRLGVNSYVRKPVDFEQFTKAVNNLGFYWLLLNETPNQKKI